MSENTHFTSPRISNQYFDVDDILATQERVMCNFEVPVLHMGYLCPGNESSHIQTGSRFELPLWMAQSFCTRRRHIASVEVPRPYRAGHRKVLDADATVVDLHKFCAFYYGVGTRLLAFDLTEATDIAQSMLLAYQTRLRKIMDASQNSTDAASLLFVETLAESEKVVFLAGQKALADFLVWETRRSEQIISSDMVTNMKKRKRVQMEET